jgi:BlaI family transcriptional regulator, penicillinase repressor
VSQARHVNLSRRERQIMDILYRRGRGTVGEVMEDLSGGPAYSTVRAQLRVLEDKGHVRHEEQGLRYVYIPTRSRQTVRQSALRHLVDTFFEGSPEQVVAALLGRERSRITDDELDRMARLIEQARREGRRK